MDGRSDLDVQKISAEIEKIRAEEEEVRLRISESRENKSRPWWRTPTFLQIAATGITGITFLGFYITYSLVPALKIENTELRIDNLETKERLMKEKAEQKAELERANESLRNDLNELKKKNITVAGQLEKAGKPQEAKDAISSAQNAQSAINQLTSRSQAASTNSIVYIQIPSFSSMAKAEQIQRLLKEKGYAAPGIEEVGNAVSPKKSQIRYFYPDQRGAANELLLLTKQSGSGDFEVKYVKGFETRAARNVLEIWFSQHS